MIVDVEDKKVICPNYKCKGGMISYIRYGQKVLNDILV